MSLAYEFDCIRQIPILSVLTPATQKMLCFASERLCYEPGQVVFRQGDPADAAYIILDGTVEVVLWTRTGSLLINTVEQYGIIGEIGMFGDLPRSATAIARTQLGTLRVPREVFRNTVQAHPDAAMRLSALLAQRLANTTAQLCAAAG
jgi:CRP-like cAMP-binding protein